MRLIQSKNLLLSSSDDCTVISWIYSNTEHKIHHKFEGFALPVVHLHFNEPKNKIFALMESGVVEAFKLNFLSKSKTKFNRFAEHSSGDKFDVSVDGSRLFGVSEFQLSELCVFSNKNNSQSQTIVTPYKTHRFTFSEIK